MKTNKNYIFDFLSIISFVYVIAVSFLIYARIDENGNLINGIFAADVNFKQINDQIDSFFNRLFHFGIVQGDEEVDAQVTYLELGEHRFKMEDQNILALQDGTVTYATKEDTSFVIVVNYGEYQAIYRNINNALVACMDHLLQGDTIGEYEDSFICNFFKDSKEVPFSQVQNSD